MSFKICLTKKQFAELIHAMKKKANTQKGVLAKDFFGAMVKKAEV